MLLRTLTTALLLLLLARALPADDDADHAAAAQLKNPQAASAGSLAAGKSLYVKWCQVCHAADGRGAPAMGYLKPAPDMTDATWLRGGSDGEIFDSIQNGVPPSFNMEPWAERLKDAEIWDLVNYIRSLQRS